MAAPPAYIKSVHSSRRIAQKGGDLLLLLLRSGYSTRCVLLRQIETLPENYWFKDQQIFDRRSDVEVGNDCLHWVHEEDFIPNYIDESGRNLTRNSSYTGYDLPSVDTRQLAGSNAYVIDDHDDAFLYRRVWYYFEYYVATGTSLSVYRCSYVSSRNMWSVTLYRDDFDIDTDRNKYRIRTINANIGNIPNSSWTQVKADLRDLYDLVIPPPWSSWLAIGDSHVTLLTGRKYRPDERLCIISNLTSLLYETFGEDLFPPDSSVDEEVRDAIDNTRVNHVNLLSFPKELLGTISGVEAYKLAQDIINYSKSPGSEAVKGVASSLYLNGRYGATLTGVDLEAMVENEFGPQWRKALHAKAYGSSHYQRFILGLTFDCVCHVSFDYSFNGLNYFIKRWDNANLPTLSDVWDVIPYSFVVDWAVGVGDTLADFERGIYRSHMDISNIWQTVKASTSGTLVSDAGRQEYKLYVFLRKALGYLPAVAGTPRGVGGVKNLVDSTALWIQAT